MNVVASLVCSMSRKEGWLRAKRTLIFGTGWITAPDGGFSLGGFRFLSSHLMTSMCSASSRLSTMASTATNAAFGSVLKICGGINQGAGQPVTTVSTKTSPIRARVNCFAESEANRRTTEQRDWKVMAYTLTSCFEPGGGEFPSHFWCRTLVEGSLS